MSYSDSNRASIPYLVALMDQFGANRLFGPDKTGLAHEFQRYLHDRDQTKGCDGVEQQWFNAIHPRHIGMALFEHQHMVLTLEARWEGLRVLGAWAPSCVQYWVHTPITLTPSVSTQRARAPRRGPRPIPPGLLDLIQHRTKALDGVWRFSTSSAHAQVAMLQGLSQTSYGQRLARRLRYAADAPGFDLVLERTALALTVLVSVHAAPQTPVGRLIWIAVCPNPV